MTPQLFSTEVLELICYQECSWGTLGGNSLGTLLVIHRFADQLPSIRDNSATSLNEIFELISGSYLAASWPRRDARSAYSNSIERDCADFFDNLHHFSCKRLSHPYHHTYHHNYYQLCCHACFHMC